MNQIGEMTDQAAVDWGKAVLIAGGLAWIGRAALEIVFQPNYWNPQTAVDCAAVGGFSLALILLALGVWAIHRDRAPQSGLRKWACLIGIGPACGGALLPGAANFFEDWLGFKALGEAFIWGSLATFAGLLPAGISAIGAGDLPRWTPWLLIACALGLGLMDNGGGFLTGTALILLGLFPGYKQTGQQPAAN